MTEKEKLLAIELEEWKSRAYQSQEEQSKTQLQIMTILDEFEQVLYQLNVKDQIIDMMSGS